MSIFSLASLCCSLLFTSPTVSFETLRTLAPIPESSDFVLEQPGGIAIDDQGRYYLVDTDARVIFSWEADGRFRGTFGKPGKGPGEFVFRGRGGGQAFMAVRNEELWVLDGGKRALTILGTDGRFKREVPLNFGRGRITFFDIMPNGSWLVSQRRRGENNIVREFFITKSDGSRGETIFSEPDQTFQISGSSRQNRRFTMQAYAPTKVVHADISRGELIMGDGSSPAIEIISLTDRSKKQHFKLPLLRRAIETADRKEMEERFANNSRRRSRLTIEYPEKMPYFSRVVSAGQAGWLVFNESPFYHKLQGILVSRDGQQHARFQLTCGENGTLMGTQGRLVIVRLDEEDEFAISEIKPKS